MPAEDILMKALELMDRDGSASTVKVRYMNSKPVRDSKQRAKEAENRSEALRVRLNDEMRAYEKYLEEVDYMLENDTICACIPYGGKIRQNVKTRWTKTGARDKFKAGKDDPLDMSLENDRWTKSLGPNASKRSAGFELTSPYKEWAANAPPIVPPEHVRKMGIVGPEFFQHIQDVKEWKERADRKRNHMIDTDVAYQKKLEDLKNHLEMQDDQHGCIPGASVEGSERVPPVRLICEQKLVSPYIEELPRKLKEQNSRTRARTEMMKDQTRGYLRKMNGLKTMSFSEHVEYEKSQGR